MLRPATPLTILLFISFILLLLSVLSTPIIKGIPLASFKNVDFGVFGYCKPDGQCSGLRVGYTTDGVFGDSSNDGDFSLPSGARHQLSSLLIVHPVAALLNLVCLALAGAAHLHSPSHSARYLLGLLILFLPTLLVSLLAFLVDILLFVPHLQWGGWIVLASTVMIAISGIVTCAMRRTLVSRKARKRRIAENAEMSGENYYGRQDALPKFDTSPPLSPESKPPMVNGAPGADNLPSFATYDANRKISDERIPLNQRTPSNRAPGSAPPESRDGSERYGPSSVGTQRSPKDEFGNPLPPGAFDNQPPLRRDPSDPRMREQYMNQGMRPMMPPPSRGGLNPRGRGGYGPPRGRGGFGPGPYGPGGFDPRGPPQGYPPRGGFGPRGVPRGGPYGARGAPYGPGRGGPPGGPGMRGGLMMGRGQGPPPGYPPQQGRGMPPPDQTLPETEAPPNQYDIIDDYSRNTLYSRQTQDIAPLPETQGVPPSMPGQATRGQSPYGARAQSPGGPGRMRQPSPAPPMPGNAPVGQAVEMDASTGRSSDLTSAYGPPGNRVRASDDEIQGMIGLQQQRQNSPPARPPGVQSPTSLYSQAEYVPPRLAWARKNSSPLNENPPPAHRRTASSDNYYEDIDPRFAEPERRSPNHPQALTAGGLPPAGADGSFEDIPEGARSPAASDISHFTSVSQRGVNPNWRPGAADMNMMPGRKPIQTRPRDVLLGNNPDFELGAAGRGRGGGMMGRGGGRMPVGMPAGMPAPGAGGGRYPTGM